MKAKAMTRSSDVFIHSEKISENRRHEMTSKVLMKQFGDFNDFNLVSNFSIKEP